MDNKKYRTYPQEFKLEALGLLKRGDKSASQLEQELGITPGLLVKWRTRYKILEKDGIGVKIGPSDLEEAKTEIRRLQKELSGVEEEREILKKVLSIFSRPGE